MYEFHDDGVAFLRSRERAMLGDEPGLGKSRQLLLAAEGRTLVVAPAMVLDGGVWDDEHTRWRPDLDLTQASYSSLNARRKTEKGGTTPTPELRPEYRGAWDTVILDEVHYAKNRNTSWTGAVQQICRQAGRVYLATGTPIPNWAYELYVPLTLLHPAESVRGGTYGSYWRWAKEWFNVYNQWGGMKVGKLRACSRECLARRWPDVCEHWKHFHDANLGGVWLQRLRDDVLPDLPPLSRQVVHCVMPPEQARVYRALEEDFIAWTESGTEVVAWNQAAQTVKLAKACTSLALFDPLTKCVGPKIQQLRLRLESQARPSLVVAHFRSTVLLAAANAVELGLRTAVVDGSTSKLRRKQLIRGFQAGEYDVLCATIETVAEGLTLTRADTVHRLERSYRPSRNEQTIRRIHRIGQTVPVAIVDYVATGTIDEKILSLLERKTDQQLKALRPRAIADVLRREASSRPEKSLNRPKAVQAPPR